MKKSRFDIISDLFKLSNVISGSLKLAESLADKSSGSDETDCKDICRNIRYNLKPLSFLLAGIREYVTEHEDKELARKFVELHDDTKRLHGICSKYADLNKAAFRTGVAYLSMEVISQYFFPEKEQEQVSPEGSDISPKSMTRTEATDCIDTIRAAMRLAPGEAMLLLDEVCFNRLCRPVMRSLSYYTNFFDFSILRKLL